MKKFFYLFFALSFIALSCSEEPESINTEIFHLSTEQIKNIAIQHNQAMKFIYDDLSNELNEKKDINSKFEALNHSMNLYFQKTTNNDSILGFMQTTGKIYLNKAISFDYQTSHGRLVHKESPILSILKENRQHLSEFQIRLLLKCDKALSKDHDGLDEVFKYINHIKSESNSLPENERVIVLVAIEICKYSAMYWSEYLDDWDMLLNGTNQNSRTKAGSDFDWGEVAKMDVAGAIGGATYATVVNVVPGWGQAAYGSSILGAAIGGSAAGAAKQLLDKWF